MYARQAPRLIVLVLAILTIGRSTAIPTIDWWKIGPNANWDELCKLWPTTDRPEDFPQEMEYPYAGTSVEGQLKFEEEDGTVLHILLTQVPNEPNLVLPIDKFGLTSFYLSVQKISAEYPDLVLTEGKVVVWMAASNEKGVVLVIKLPSDDLIEVFVSAPAFAAPCDMY